MTIRDRVKELRRVRAGDLRPHPDNWRTHPKKQREALRGVLDEVGYADALVVRELPDGSLQLVDGHLRAETTPDLEVPVLVVDLTDDETERVLLTHDPLSAMARADADCLSKLLARAESEHQPVQELLGRLAEKAGVFDRDAIAGAAEVEVPLSYQVVVECRDDGEQQHVFERMRKEGYRCRVLTL